MTCTNLMITCPLFAVEIHGFLCRVESTRVQQVGADHDARAALWKTRKKYIVNTLDEYMPWLCLIHMWVI